MKRRMMMWMGMMGVVMMVGCAGPRLNLGYEVDRSVALSDAEVSRILDQAEAAAEREKSLLRVGEDGEALTVRMHIIVMDRCGKIVGRRSMDDAWGGSVSIAKGKAFTAMAFSSDANALTSRSIGVLSQPGQPLWQIGNSNTAFGIIEFPGGIPLYKNGKLAGAIGVSGDGVEQDENVAEAGSRGFEAPMNIRIDHVLGSEGLYTK